MPSIVLLSRELDRDASAAKKAAKHSPTFVTDRGRPAHALLSVNAYPELTGAEKSLLEALAQPDARDFDFEPPR
ncbi:MAG TPA: type II toxin-antitoxin system Phd/YefM family antitoxin, partial [Methylocystis sp.]|nr:type II toxin-antitoxin system Phd/YefM family antitoxin [Methylocystis sp.]